jgi:hypothetical protein
MKSHKLGPKAIGYRSPKAPNVVKRAQKDLKTNKPDIIIDKSHIFSY